MINSITEDMYEFGKVGAEMSYFQPQTHSDCDSAESIADSDLEDGELRKMLAQKVLGSIRKVRFTQSASTSKYPRKERTSSAKSRPYEI